MKTPRVLLITDATFPDETVVRVIDACARGLPRGAFAVQLRDKERELSDRAAWTRQLREVTRALGLALVVNGDVELARTVGADGVHFGGGATERDVRSAEGMWRSTAAHRDEDVDVARERGLDAVLVSPIFESPGKGVPRGVVSLTRAVERADGRVAVVALGGVEATNARACFEAGADGVAVIRALLASESPGDVARAMYDALRR